MQHSAGPNQRLRHHIAEQCSKPYTTSLDIQHKLGTLELHNTGCSICAKLNSTHIAAGGTQQTMCIIPALTPQHTPQIPGIQLIIFVTCCRCSNQAHPVYVQHKLHAAICCSGDTLLLKHFASTAPQTGWTVVSSPCSAGTGYPALSGTLTMHLPKLRALEVPGRRMLRMLCKSPKSTAQAEVCMYGLTRGRAEVLKQVRHRCKVGAAQSLLELRVRQPMALCSCVMLLIWCCLC